MSNIFIMLITLHFIGDYYLQLNKIAEYKEKSLWGVLIHAIIYSVPALLSLLVVEGNNYLIWIILMCGAHFIIDFIKFFVKPVYYSPKSNNGDENGTKHLLKVDIRYFADQLLHLLFIGLIAVFFLTNNADISMKANIVNVLNADKDILSTLFKSAAAFIVVLQPVSLTFYKIFDIDILAQANPSKKEEAELNKPVDIKGAGAIIGFMERIIMLFLLIMGEYTSIGFVIAGKSLIRLNSNIKQEFFIIGTFYGIITTLMTYILFFKI